MHTQFAHCILMQTKLNRLEKEQRSLKELCRRFFQSESKYANEMWFCDLHQLYYLSVFTCVISSVDGNSVIYQPDLGLLLEISNVNDDVDVTQTMDSTSQIVNSVVQTVNLGNQPEIVRPPYVTLSIEPVLDVLITQGKENEAPNETQTERPNSLNKS